MQQSFFEVGDRYNHLDKAEDLLIKLSGMINCQGLLLVIEPVHFKRTAKGGRPGTEPLVITKRILLQPLYNLSDDSCEYQTNDRLSFKRFGGLLVPEKSLGTKTLWFYKERTKCKKLHDKIFDWLHGQIEVCVYVAQEGQIVDANLVAAHKPTGKDKKQLEKEVPLTKAQSSQTDNDTTFTKKNKKSHYDYKDHIQIDNKHKIVRKQVATTASFHSSQEFEGLFGEEGNDSSYVWRDSAYRILTNKGALKKKNLNSKVHERVCHNNLPSDGQEANNTTKSKTRVCVEYVFGYRATSAAGIFIHTIGLAKAEVKVTLKNVTYNIQRFVFLESKRLAG